MRAELLGQIVGAQFELERSITTMAQGGARGEGEQQLQALKDLQRQIGSASPAKLSALRAEIVSAVAIAHSAAQQGQATKTADSIAALAETASASRQQVTAAMHDMHRFDPYLHFASRDEEDAYRNREAERRAYIDEQQAKGTPQADLNAAGSAVGQMVDAKANGAGDSPEFQQRWNELVTTTEKLREAARANGISTEEFDRNLRNDLRRVLKSKGLSDTQIDARFAAQPDPLEAAKTFVQGDGDLQKLRQSASDAAYRTDASRSTIVSTAAPEMTGGNIDDAIAMLQAAGIKSAEHPPGDGFAHGVSRQERPVATTRAPGN